MNNNNDMLQEEFETIEAYLNDELPTSDRIAFEKQMATDPVLQERVDEIRTMILAIQADGMKNKLEDIHQHSFPASSDTSINAAQSGKVIPIQKNGSWLNKFAIAAAVAAFVGFGIYFFSNQQSAAEQLYAEYYTQDPGLATPMSTTDDYELYRAMVDYKQQKYELAISRWSVLLKEQPQNDTLNYFIGVSNLAIQKPLVAQKNLEIVITNPSSVFYQDAAFHLGLLALKNENKSKAIEYLKKSSHDKVNEILKKIE